MMAFEPDAEPEESEVFELHPTREELNDRLDRFVASALPDLSRTYVQQLIEAGNVRVDDVTRRSKFSMTPGQVVTVVVPPPTPVEVEPEPIPLTICYEDADVIVIDKPAGMVVHPAPGHATGTLVNALLHHLPELSVGGSIRPGIVHRLDKDTSGLIAVAKSDRGRTALVQQWQERSVQKGYVALAAGVVAPDSATIDAPIGRDPIHRQRMGVIVRGRPAITHFTVRDRFLRTTLLDLAIETGRTHQIRVHLAFIGHPVVGDRVYGRESRGDPLNLPRQFLHAAHLAFHLPDGSDGSFEAPLPADLREVLIQLEDERVATP